MGQEKQSSSIELFLHLSLLLCWVVPIPFVDIIVPILIWQTTKKQNPHIEPHARNAVNWLISSTVYSVILLVTVIGTVLLPVLWGMRLVFPIIATIQASKGKVWAYPLTINFLGTKPEKQLKKAAVGFLSLVVIPLAALLGSVVWYNNHVSWLATLSSTTGTVTAVREKVDDNGDVVYQPVVEFEGPLGDFYVVSPSFWSNPPDYRKGELVSVLHPASEPEDAIIDDWPEKWLMVTIALVTSSIFLGFAFVPSAFCWIISCFV
ncbi:MAG: DUF4870 domain-containing protein [Cyanobacteria bacterium P01_H01_bin.21]